MGQGLSFRWWLSAAIVLTALGGGLAKALAQSSDASDSTQATSSARLQPFVALPAGLDSPDKTVRRDAVDQLIVMARDSPAVRPRLIDALANSNEDVVSRVEEKLVQESFVNDEGVWIVAILRQGLEDSDSRKRGASALTLSRILAANARVLAPLNDSETIVTPWKNWKGPSPQEMIVEVAKALSDVDSQKRSEAIANLAQTGPDGKGALPYVLPFLKSSDLLVRGASLQYLAAIGPDAKVAVGDVIPMLSDASRGVRLDAIEVLGHCGAAAKAAVPQLAIALGSSDTDLSDQAAIALASIDPNHPGILPALERAIGIAQQREDAINGMGEMGNRALPAGPALEKVLASDDQPSEQRAAVRALGRIEGSSAVPSLARVIGETKFDSVRKASIEALAEMGPDNGVSVAALVDTLNNDSAVARDAASDALVKLGGRAVPMLLNGLKSPHLYERGWTIQTLNRIKPLPHEAAEALTPLQHDPSTIISAMATDALAGKSVSARDAIRNEDDYAGEEDEDNRNVELKAFEAGKLVQDTRRYSKAEMIAPIPPDANHQYPLELEYLAPVVLPDDSPREGAFMVSVHSATGHPDRLSVWKKTGEDQYKLMFTETADEDSQFDQPKVFSAVALISETGRDYPQRWMFVDLPLHHYWADGNGIEDRVFAVDDAGDGLWPVAIQPVEDWYDKQLRPGEWTWNSFGNNFAEDHLAFSFHIWEGGQCHACPGGAEVEGTYKVIRDEHFDQQKRDWVDDWKMVVDTIKRGPTTSVSR